MKPGLRCGVYLPNFGAFGDARTLAALASDAEMAGWDGFFIWDHIARPLRIDMVDPWVAVTAIAVTTSRIRIGAMVTPLPRRRPWKVAREAVSIDHLSGGRLVFGVGTGSSGGGVVEWEQLGEERDAKTRGAMLDEGLEILTGLWGGQPFSYAGKYYHVERSQFLPVPLQAPRIPIWVAGSWPHKPPFRRAARWDGVFPWFGRDQGDSLGELRRIVDYVRRHRTHEDPFEVVYATPPLHQRERSAASRELSAFAAAGATWWLERLEPDFFGAPWNGTWPFERMRDHVRQGPPPAAAAALGR
jgi:alkanesulfonate monooxygenase SsuD/methylene tetrahydromethanopterin reductase-like flavin-dependent oxidoreductase (luciferase family)